MVMKELVDKSATNLNGYGCCGSPGHNAKYSTYTLDDDTGKVVAFSVVQVSVVTSSNTMEEGF